MLDEQTEQGFTVGFHPQMIKKQPLPTLLTSKRAVHSGANCRILLLCNNHGVFLGSEWKGSCMCVCVCVCACVWLAGLICVSVWMFVCTWSDKVQSVCSCTDYRGCLVFSIEALGDVHINEDWITSVYIHVNWSAYINVISWHNTLFFFCLILIENPDNLLTITKLWKSGRPAHVFVWFWINLLLKQSSAAMWGISHVVSGIHSGV